MFQMDFCRVATVAACYFGPVYPPYYAWLDRFWPGTHSRVLFKKLMFDQGVMGIAGTLVFFGGVNKNFPICLFCEPNAIDSGLCFVGDVSTGLTP